VAEAHTGSFGGVDIHAERVHVVVDFLKKRQFVTKLEMYAEPTVQTTSQNTAVRIVVNTVWMEESLHTVLF
jgi:hypothetical protein